MNTERHQTSGPGEEPSIAEAVQVPADIGTRPSALQMVLIVVLVCTLAIVAIALLRQLAPDGPWQLMPLFALIVALESVLTRRWLESSGRQHLYRMYALAELLVLLTLAPLFLWLASGQVPFPESLIELLENPFIVFSGPLILYMLLAVLVWYRAHRWAETFLRLAVTPDEVKFHASTATERASDWSIVPPIKYRPKLLQTFVQSWIAGGVFLIVIAALTSVDLGDLSQTLSGGQNLRTVTRLGLPEEVLLGLLVYFLGGLWLISQGRAMVLKGRWLAGGSQRDSSVIARWRNWALLLIGCLALLALFLPIGNTYPLVQILAALARLGYNAVIVLLALLSRLLFFILSLLPGGEAPAEPLAPFDPADLFQQAPPQAEPSLSVPTLFAGTAFWLALIAVTIVATVYFLSERGPDVTFAQLTTLWRRFLGWLLAFGQNAADRMSVRVRPIRWPFRRPTLDAVSRAPFGFLRVGGLPPKEQVRFLYLSLVRYAGKQGLPRPPADTANEFTQSLKSEWPEVGPQLDQLTDAFLAARYTAAEVDERRLKSAKDAWLQIRRRKSRSSE